MYDVTMKIQHFYLTFLTLTLTLLLFQASTQAQAPQPTLRLTPNPIHLTEQPNQTSVMAVEVAEVSDLHAIDVALRFDPNVVEVVDADPTQSGVQAGLGDALSSQTFFVAVNRVSAGQIEFAGTVVAGGQPFSGQGELLKVTWRAKAGGQSDLTLTKAVLVDSANTPIVAATQHGRLTVGRSITLVGQVQRQGGNDHSGITITNGLKQAQTTADGRFSLAGVTPYSLTLSAPKYLRVMVTGQASSAEPSTVDLGQITLLAGDLNQDGKIDIFDISLLGSRYNKGDSDSDLTGDGRVDIFDLSLAAANFGQPKLTP